MSRAFGGRIGSGLRAFVLACVACIAAFPAMGQVSVGADFVSRYIWRGFKFGESVAVQPALTVASGGFEVGAWGSYSISSSGENEADLWAAYTISGESGFSVTLGLTDYYFPTPGQVPYGDADSHNLEASVAISGPDNFPVGLYAGVLTGQDGVYLEASLPLLVSGVEMGLTLGTVAGGSDFYGLEEGGIVNLGVSASKALTVTNSFEIPLGVAYIINPATDEAHLVFTLSLSS